MTVNGWKVADSDMHIMEPADLWEKYIAPEWRHAAPIGLSELHRDMRVRVKGTVLTRVAPVKPNFDVTVGWKPNQDSAYAAAEARNWDAKSQLTAMDEEGLDVAVLFPSRSLFVLGLDTTEQVGPEGLAPDLAATGCTTSAPRTRRACTARDCLHRTTSTSRSTRSSGA
jgi:hypothetical protein